MKHLNNGIYLDFKQHLMIRIVDDVFTNYEITALKHHTINIHFISKGMVKLFLIQINDCLETSDIPFSYQDLDNIHDFLHNNVLEILFETKGKVMASRRLTLPKGFMDILKEDYLQDQKASYPFEEFDLVLHRIYQKYEPFELEEDAIATFSSSLI